MDCDKDKVIVKSSGWPGVDKSIVDFNQVHTIPIMRTKVVLAPYVKGALAFIGVKDGIEGGEVIQVGNLGQKFKIIGNPIKVLPYGGYLYRFKRLDGGNMSMTDINAISIGDKVKLKSRRSFDQTFGQVADLLNS